MQLTLDNLFTIPGLTLLVLVFIAFTLYGVADNSKNVLTDKLGDIIEKLGDIADKLENDETETSEELPPHFKV